MILCVIDSLTTQVHFPCPIHTFKQFIDNDNFGKSAWFTTVQICFTCEDAWRKSQNASQYHVQVDKILNESINSLSYRCISYANVRFCALFVISAQILETYSFCKSLWFSTVEQYSTLSYTWHNFLKHCTVSDRDIPNFKQIY